MRLLNGGHQLEKFKSSIEVASVYTMLESREVELSEFSSLELHKNQETSSITNGVETNNKLDLLDRIDILDAIREQNSNIK